MFKRALLIALLAVMATGLLFPALSLAQGSVTVTPNRDYINVRLWPAIGATVVGSMAPGDVMTATGRSFDGEWVRIDFLGSEAWVGLVVVNVSGDINSLPLADPRAIPYNSSAGGGSASGVLSGRLDDAGIRLRSGPSTAYPVMANLPRYATFPITGRTDSGRWVQISWEGLIGWAATRYMTLESPSGATLNDVPVIPPAAQTGVRLSDDSARDRFLTVDEIRRHVNQARATADVIDGAWNAVSGGSFPAVCSAPPVIDTYFLKAMDRHMFPDLVEAVAVLNQSINDVNYAVTTWLDGCLKGSISGETAGIARAAIARARAGFDNVLFRITASKAVMVQAIHAHINYSQDQFERIEAIWLDVRFGVIGDPPCINQPQQPLDYALTEWESATYPDLIPLVNRLNEGLAVLRQAIVLWKNECSNFATVPAYVLPGEVAAQGYNTMMEARVILNDVRDNYLNAAYASGDYIIPAPTATPNPEIEAILHPLYTPTFTLTPTPSFSFSGSATLTRSTLHPGCSWFGIAGQVLNASGSPRPAALVHVYGPGLDVRILSGTDGRYGASGWEVPVASNAAQNNTYTARIEDGFGNPLSPDQRIRFSSDCTMNVAMVTFSSLQ